MPIPPYYLEVMLGGRMACVIAMSGGMACVIAMMMYMGGFLKVLF